MGSDKICYSELLQQKDDTKMLNFSTSVKATKLSNNLAKMSNGIQSSYSSGWDPVVSFNQDQFFDLHLPVVLQNQQIPSFVHLNDQKQRTAANACKITEDLGASSKGKQKACEIEKLRNSTMDQEKKAQLIISRGKQVGEKTRENYVHVRAKRGQATNSHSLAERVRREKISERMKMLQELVPGCNKISSKAVMLDEIINYVQSLQQQVEFLSMKLATVNSEINVDLERILPNEVFHDDPELSFPQLFHGLAQITTNPNFHHLAAPNLWNSELQSIYKTGFGFSLKPNGPS